MAKEKKTVVEAEDLEHEMPEDESVEDQNEYEEEEELEEGTEAAESLKPAAKSVADPKSRIETMKAVIGAIASASSDELSHWWEQAQNLDHNAAREIPDGNAAHNKASVEMHPSDAVKESVKEDLKVLFDADKTLTEEARTKLETIFEAAVTARVIIEREQMEEDNLEVISEQIEEIKLEIEEQLNSYLQYCTENWMEENQVAVESALRSELTEEFMEGLRGLFAEHFINIPTEKSDVIEALSEQIEELEAVLNDVIGENNELKGLNTESELENAIEEVAEGLTVSQAEKLATLSEGIEFDGDVEAFKKKVAIIKETYFKPTGAAATTEDDFERTDNELNEETTVIGDPIMRKYSESISRTSKDR